MARITTNTTTDLNAWEILKTSEAGGGGSGGGVSSIDVASGIDASADINTIVNTLVRVAATPLPQSSLSIAASALASYIIPLNCRCLTICINSGSLVYFTEDGSTPTANSCWFAGGSKEIWETNIPQGSTLRLLAVSTATISIQARV